MHQRQRCLETAFCQCQGFRFAGQVDVVRCCCTKWARGPAISLWGLGLDEKLVFFRGGSLAQFDVTFRLSSM